MSISSVITERLSVLHRLPEDISRGCALSRLRFASWGCALSRLRFASPWNNARAFLPLGRLPDGEESQV